EVLGWGGFWAWDPVENASFIPWLTATAYLHSVMVQERRGMLRIWNLSLLLATFSLTILGTFLTRSGVLESVHSFTESPIGPWILTFFGLVVFTSVGLIAWRGDRHVGRRPLRGDRTARAGAARRLLAGDVRRGVRRAPVGAVGPPPGMGGPGRPGQRRHDRPHRRRADRRGLRRQPRLRPQPR